MRRLAILKGADRTGFFVNSCVGMKSYLSYSHVGGRGGIVDVEQDTECVHEK